MQTLPFQSELLSMFDDSTVCGIFQWIIPNIPINFAALFPAALKRNALYVKISVIFNLLF